MSTQKQPPEQLRGDNMTARVVRQKIWRRCNVKNMHFMGAIVGREGTGKSLTALKIAELVDPSFTVDRVIFEPARLVEMIQEGEIGQGDMVVLDEAGVGLGSRSWYEKGQILLNQTLQVIRDENIACVFTLPRLSELDSQSRGRLHAYLEMVEINKQENWARAKWKNIDPTRDEKDKIYKKYPRMRVNGSPQRITSIYFNPPSEELVAAYEQRKQQFQAELYEDTIAELREEQDGEDEASPQDIADDIIEGDVEEFVDDNHGQRYFNRDKVEMAYDVGPSISKKVKIVLQSEGLLDDCL